MPDRNKLFRGKPKKVEIVSNNTVFFSPEPEEEIEQKLIISSSGDVRFSAYQFDDTLLRKRHFKIEPDAADAILNAVVDYFNTADPDYIEDVGIWELTITNASGTAYKMSGSLNDDSEPELSLSKFIRKTLGMDDLFLFDGRARTDIVERVSIDYKRILTNADDKLCYSEEININRKFGVLEHIRRIGAGHIVTQKYFVPEEIEELLDSIDEKNLFGEIPGEPDDIAPTPDDVNSYTITVDLKSGAHREISGTYDKYGLPAGWRYFVRRMCELVSAYDFTDVLSPSMYDRTKRRKSDIIYCSVEFEEGYKSYYYITDDDSIEPGDRVVVPAGRDNHEAVVEVVKVEYFQPENVPLPIEKTKHILRKYIPEKKS